MNVYSYQCGKVKKWRFDKRVNRVRLQGKGFRTRAEAIKVLNERIDEAKKMTGTDFLKLCKECLDYSESRHAIKTFKYKKATIKRFLTCYGRTDFPAPLDILHYLKKRANEVSANAYNADRKELHALFEFGKKFGLATLNPVSKVDRTGWKRSVRYIPPIEHINAVLLVAGSYRDLLECCLYTLGRKSEILKLRWEDIDFERNTIRLWTRKRKDGSDEYDELPMPNPLSRLLHRRKLDGTRKRHAHKSEWVFPNFYAGPRGSASGRFSHLSQLMPRLCRKAGVRAFGFHALRHYGASYLARRGVDLGTIQKLLRHKNQRTTEIYLHTLSEDIKRGAEVLGEIGESTSESNKGAKHAK